MGLSIRAYAQHRDIIHEAVRKAIAAGRIQKEPDGSIDPAKADAQWQVYTRPAVLPSVKSVATPVAKPAATTSASYSHPRRCCHPAMKRAVVDEFHQRDRPIAGPGRVASAKGRKVLGYRLWFAKEGVKRRVVDKPMVIQATGAATDPALRRTQHGGGNRQAQTLPAGLEGLIRDGTNTGCLAKAGRMATPSIAGDSTQATMTSTARAARCGPACWVVLGGRSVF